MLFDMKIKPKKDETVQYGFRLPVDLRDVLEVIAAEQERTLSQEIIFRLRRSLLQDDSGVAQKLPAE